MNVFQRNNQNKIKGCLDFQALAYTANKNL